jgi:hypothetical protein
LYVCYSIPCCIWLGNSKHINGDRKADTNSNKNVDLIESKNIKINKLLIGNLPARFKQGCQMGYFQTKNTKFG